NTNGGAVVGTFTQNVTVVHTSGDIAPSSSIVGQADLSSATLTLTDATVLDLSSSKTSQSSSDVTVGGNIVTLTQQVVLQSGVDTQPIVLTNSNLAGVSVSIPDGTKVQGPAGWDGTIQPPKTGSNAGTAPSGFSVGSTVISVGSPGAVLVFDTPVTLTLTGVTGAVGYKPAGSDTWVQITNTCAGDYGAPTPPTAPGECKISNGTDTKIVTFHFTEFGELDPIPASVSSSGRTGSRAGDFARSSVTGVGQVLGAFTETERQAQIATIRTSLISLIQQLIGLLQAQLAAAITAGNQ
ncbi:MAG: hypothetical protein Q8Q86_03845, partial [Candidatus Daviesbacteria bacterium]|nr:hypothetical protein [Candidatus Daviesbacteria bacterium]